jgi:hypothetical protein
MANISKAAAILGRKGGKSKSERKIAASRANGNLPKKPKLPTEKHSEIDELSARVKALLK